MKSPIANLQALTDEFTAAFPQKLRGPRTIGREAEHPLVDANGAFVDVSELFPALAAPGDLTPKYDSAYPDLLVSLSGPEFSYALEVGKGTIEINTRPCADLFQVEQSYQAALSRLVDAAAARNWRVLGYGIQPVSPPSLPLLTPKQRYEALLERMGDEWFWYAVTASDQAQIDIARPELLTQLNTGLLMAPVIIALCANSPVVGGQLLGFASTREGHMCSTTPFDQRHGMPVTAYDSIEEFIARLAKLDVLLRREGTYLLPDWGRFDEKLRAGPVEFDDFLLHDHYIWHSARLRTAYATVELRPACQQPASESMVVSALCLGLVEAAEAIHAFVTERLGPNYWLRMRSWHRSVITSGLAAPEPAQDFLEGILRLAEEAVAARGLGEEIYFAPLWQRLEKKEDPAQAARRVFLQKGMEGLLDFVQVQAVDNR
ncbi:MAG: glutamate-cysteine ligase family protein [Caldilineaceae bacterium]